MRKRAFTLLEMLVAMTIFVMLALLLSQIIGPTMDVVGKSRRFFDLHSRARAALDIIARDLGNGVYRADLETFRDESDEPALAFFTRRAGLVDPSANPTDYRQLSFVVYQTLPEKDGEPDFSLWRGSINVEWENNVTYPQVVLTGPMPFLDGAVPLAYAKSVQEPTMEPVLTGIARLELRFLGTDGRYRKTYNADSDVGPVSKAACITLLVTDEKTHNQIVDDSTILATFETSFLDSSGKLAAPDESDISLGTLWNQALDEAATWNGFPPRLRTLYAFERTIPLR